MWLLSCTGDLFSGKRLWLRPGTTHLLGRTSGLPENGEQIKHIDHRSVSRKHLLIEIGDVPAEDITQLHTRSKLTIKDSSKIGTTVNGEKVVQETRVLNEKKYTIKLGSYEPLFHIEWHPVTLTLASLGKKKDAALAAARERFKQTDVKVVAEYVINETTHCLAKRRNTPAVLQALCQGRWVVAESYQEAVAEVLQRAGPDGMSVLENDFDGEWPKEEKFPVPAGQEPVARSDNYLLPNPARAEVFQGFTFLFSAQPQYDSLLPVVTAGGGKALLHEFESDMSVDHYVNWVKSVMDHKQGRGQSGQGGCKGGVVLVRNNQMDQAERQFMAGVDIALDQRSIEQNSFLDRILTLDTSEWIRPLPEASQSVAPESQTQRQSLSRASIDAAQGERRASDANSRSEVNGGSQRIKPSRSSVAPEVPEEQRPRATTFRDTPPPADQQPEESQRAREPSPSETAAATRRRNRRLITQSRLKTFDDFDPSQFSRPAASQSPEPSVQPEPSQAASRHSTDVDEPSQAAQTQQSTRKRAAPSPPEEEEDAFAGVLTAHNALKRRKLAAGQPTTPASQPAIDSKATEKATRAKKKKKEIDVMAEVQANREREEEKYRKDQEALEGDHTITEEELKRIKEAMVEEIELPIRDPPPRRTATGQGDRWDPAWNGRKNFKKFRPQGQRNGNVPRAPRVIVTLEEAPKRGFAIGSDWLETPSSNATTGRSQGKSQSQSQNARRSPQTNATGGEDDDDERTLFRRRLQASREEDEAEAAATEVVPEEIAGNARDRGLETLAKQNAKARDKRFASQSGSNSTPSQTFGTETQRKERGKRPADDAGLPLPVAKKARPASRVAREVVDVEDEEEDALQFRRRRR